MNSFKAEKHLPSIPLKVHTEWTFRPKEMIICPSCSFCDLSVKIHNLEKHFKMRHPASPGPCLDCQGCGESGVTMAQVAQHIHCNIQQHTLEPSDAFKDIEVLKDVSDQVTWNFRPKKQVECPLCKTNNRSTVKIKNLSSHILKYHDGQDGEAKFDKVKKVKLDQIGCSGCKASKVGYVNLMMHWYCQSSREEGKMNDKMWQESKKEDIKQEVKTEEGVMTEEEGEGSKMHRSVKDGKRPFTIVRHISLIQKMKDLTDQVTTSQQAEARVRKAKTAAVAKLLMEGIFYKIDQNLTWCETCSVTIFGGAGKTKASRKKQKSQLIKHMLGRKHTLKLGLTEK